MNVNNEQQEQQTTNTQLNKNQSTRKTKRFKRKHHQSNIITRAIPTTKSNYQYKQQETMQLAILDIGSSADPTQFLTDYSMMSNIDFKQMLSAAIVTDTSLNSFVELLDTDEKLTFIRKLTHLINQINYLKLQDKQWYYYYTLGMTEGIWTGRVSKKTAMVNSMYYTYGRSKVIIEQRRKIYQKEHEQMEKEINEYIKQSPVLTDLDKIKGIVTDLVHKNQYQLRIELERRRGMLKFDAKEHQFVQAFYDLKPRDTEIRSAKIIWKAVDDEQLLRYEIAMFKNWLSFKSQPNTYALQDLALTKINEIFIQHAFDQQSTSNNTLSNHEENCMAKFINDLTVKTLSKAEEIVETYVQQVNNEKIKLFNNRDKFTKPPTVDTVVAAIENRRTNMIERAQYNTDHKLKIIFGKTFTKTV